MRLILLLGLFIATITALELPSTWGSSMVVEADVPNKLWGVDVAGSSIAVSAFGASYNATADSSGAWSVMIAAQGKSTTPATITVYSSSGGSLSLTDVLVGYTVVCSGQSNMQLTVGATYDYVTETADADTLGATLRIFLKVLGEHGVAQFGAPGERFNPNVHEAVAMVPAAAGQEANSVVAVLKVGYMFKDRVLRPAQVTVAMRAAAMEEAKAATDATAGSSRSL